MTQDVLGKTWDVVLVKNKSEEGGVHRHSSTLPPESTTLRILRIHHRQILRLLAPLAYPKIFLRLEGEDTDLGHGVSCNMMIYLQQLAFPVTTVAQDTAFNFNDEI